mgnify:CR=1 FL=1
MKIKIIIFNLLTLIIFKSFAYSENFLINAANYTVKIKAKSQYPFAETEGPGSWMGAGFLINKEKGYFLTNAHVSGRGDTKLKLKFKNGSYKSVKPVYIDPEYDLAILKINQDDIPNYALEADLDCYFLAKPGTEVAAFGHPNGLSFSASRGIISQELVLNERKVIQTDAAINPGNSGGPLINLKNGRVVGINKSKYKRNSEGLGFAVPIYIACKILELLKEKKDPSPPIIDIRFAKDIDEVESNIIAFLKHNNKYIEMGSRLIEANGYKIYDSSDLNFILRGSKSPTVLKIQNENRIKSYTINFKKQKKILNREFLFLDGAIVSEQIQVDKNFLNRKFYIHSVLKGSVADQKDLGPGCWLRFVNGIEPENLVKLYIILRTKTTADIIYTCWSSKDHILTQNYHTEMKIKKGRIYLNSKNFIRPNPNGIYKTNY